MEKLTVDSNTLGSTSHFWSDYRFPRTLSCPHVGRAALRAATVSKLMRPPWLCPGPAIANANHAMQDLCLSLFDYIDYIYMPGICLSRCPKQMTRIISHLQSTIYTMHVIEEHLSLCTCALKLCFLLASLVFCPLSAMAEAPLMRTSAPSSAGQFQVGRFTSSRL